MSLTNTNKKSAFVETSEKNEEQLQEPSLENKNISCNQTIYGGGEPKLLGQNTLTNRLADIVRKVRLRSAAQRLLNATPSRMLKNMKPHQYAFINDKSQDFSDLNKRKKQIFQLNVQSIERKIMVSTCYQLFSKILRKIPIINPSSNLKYTWDLVISLSLLVGFILLSAMISFGPEEFGTGNDFTVQLVLIICAADIIVTCNTGFYKRGIICNNRGSIWRKYNNEQLSQDEFSLIPLLIHLILTYQIGEQEILGFLLLPMLLRWKPIMRASNHASQKYILKPNLRNITKLISLFFKILLIAHVCACIWIFTGRQSQRIWKSSWIEFKNLTEEPWPRQYLSAFYFCTVTMATVGYGDIVPQSSIELAVCIFMVLFACGVFGFSVNTIQGILADFSKQELEISQKMITIKNYLETKGVGPSLSKDVTEYLEYFWRANQQRNQEEEEKMINQLSDSLKMELLLESNKIVLRESTIFSSNFSEEVMKKTIPLIQEQRFTPSEVIFSHENDEYLDRSIFFVQEGFVEVYISTAICDGQGTEISQGFKSLRRLNKGEAFGEVEFFTGQNRVISVRSVGFSTILKIERAKFIDIIKNFPQDYEQFMHIKDRLIFLNDYQRVQHKCSSCLMYSHLLEYCPYLHFIPNKPKIIALNNRSEEQQRDKLFSRFNVRNEIQQNFLKTENNSNSNTNITKMKLHENSKKRHHRQLKLIEQTIKTYNEYNEDIIDDYAEEYLSFSIGKCDMCINIQNNINSTSNNNFNKDPSNLGNINNNNVSLNNMLSGQNPLFQQQSQHCPNCNPFNQPLKLPSSTQIINNPGISAASRANYFKRASLAKTLQDDGDDDQLSVSSSVAVVAKLQPLSLCKKQTSKYQNDSDTLKRQQIKQNTIIGSYLRSSNTNLDNPNHGYTNSFVQFGGFVPIAEVDSPKPSNRSNENHKKQQSFQQQEQQSQQQIKQKAISTNTNIPANNQVDIAEQLSTPLHAKELFFDIFCGEFETMHHFELYFPLNNFFVVVKQLLMDDEQKRRLRQKLLDQQRANLTRIAAKQKQKIINNSKVRGSFRAAMNNNTTMQTANGNAMGFDFQGLKKIVDAYERETKTARVTTVNNFDNMSVANMNYSNLNISNQINNSNNLIGQNSNQSPNAGRLQSKSVRASIGKIPELGQFFSGNRDEQSSSKKDYSSQASPQQIQKQQHRRQSAFCTSKDPNKGTQGSVQCVSSDDSQNSSEFNIYDPKYTQGQPTIVGLRQFSEDQNNNILGKIKNTINTDDNSNNFINEDNQIDVNSNIPVQVDERTGKYKIKKKEQSFSPPEQEEQILNIEHDEKPNINVSIYNNSLDDLSQNPFQFHFF